MTAPDPAQPTVRVYPTGAAWADPKTRTTPMNVAIDDVVVFTSLVPLMRAKARETFAEEAAQRHSAIDKGFVLDELQRLLNEMQAAPPPEEDAPDAPLYEARGVSLYWNRPTPNGVIPTQLTNFTATIQAETLRDEGDDAVEQRYTITGRGPNGRSVTFDHPAAKFQSMDWVSKLGAQAVVHASTGGRMLAHAANAIQILSGQPQERRVYAYLGWMPFDGQYRYLCSQGAIGAAGLDRDIAVDLDRRLLAYELAEPPTGTERIEAVRAVLDVLTTIPARVAAPLWGAAFRVVISPIDFSVHLAGQTNSLKSGLLGTVMHLFGPKFDYNRLPCSWEDTPNTLLKVAYLAKDAPLAVDEFKPKGNASKIAQLHADADKVFRALGNGSGRGRMTIDGRLRDSWAPRGTFLSSGEETPLGESLRTRLVIVELQRLEVPFIPYRRIADAGRTGLHAKAMAGFIQWLAADLDAIRSWVVDAEQDAAVRQAAAGPYLRTPANMARLYGGWLAFLRFAVAVGAIDGGAELDRLAELVEAGLLATAAAQGSATEGQDECDRFIDLLRGALRSGEANVAATDNGSPERLGLDPSMWGWAERDTNLEPRGRRIGWIDEQFIYLEPTVSYNLATRGAGQQGDGIALSKNTLHKRLMQRGYLALTDGDGRTTLQKRIAGEKERVLCISRARFGGEDDPEPVPAFDPSMYPSAGTEPGTQTGTDSREETECEMNIYAQTSLDIGAGTHDVPPVPDVPASEEHTFFSRIDRDFSPDQGRDHTSSIEMSDVLSRIGYVGYSGDTPPNVEIIRTPDALAAAIERIAAAAAVGFDTETTGLDPHTDRVRLLQFALPDGTVFVVDAWAVDVAPLTPLFAAAEGPILCGHNLQFDLRFAVAAGLPWIDNRRTFCTQIASNLLRASAKPSPKGTHSLAGAVKHWLGQTLDKEQQRSDWSIPDLSDDQITYAAKDALITLRLAAAQVTDLEQTEMQRVAAIEMACVPAVARLIWEGAPFDAEQWLALSDREAARVIDLGDRMTQLAGEVDMLGGGTVNWDSSQQVQAVLARRGVELPATNEAELLAAQDRDLLIPLLLEYREASKRSGTYGPEVVQKYVKNDRIYGDVWQCGSEAGRMSASNPNLQQVPRSPDYRRCFHPVAGRVLVKADYAQIELRIAAEIAPDKAMTTAFQAGDDPHRITAAAVAGCAVADVTKAQRQLAKAVNFGLLYGMGAARLREYAANSYGVAMTDDEAGQARATFFRTYPGLRKWHRSVKDGYTATRTLTGRRRLNLDAFTTKLNSPVQGTGADVLKLALARLYEDRGRFPTAFPVLVVHDEIVVECAASDAADVARWLSGHMEAAGAAILTTVPVEAEAAIMADWAGTPVNICPGCRRVIPTGVPIREDGVCIECVR